MGFSADFLVNLKRKWSRSTSNEARRTKHGGFHHGRLATITIRNFLENQRTFKTNKDKMELAQGKRDFEKYHRSVETAVFKFDILKYYTF